MKREPVTRRIDLVELRHQLFLHGKYRAAIPRLKTYLKSSPSDLNALGLLIRCYSRIKDWPAVLAWSDKVLAIDQAAPEVWYAKSTALLYLGDSEGAVATARSGLTYAEKLVDHNEYAYLDRDQLLSALWSSLMASARFEEALAVARGAPRQDLDDPETWAIMSLLALRRFHEAEVLVAAQGDDLAFCTWRIGVLLGHQGQFDDALPYLRQRLAFVAKPATKDFLYVSTHAECVALLGDVQMMEALVGYWSRQRLSRRHMQTLLILRIVAVSVKSRQSAVQLIRDWQDSMTDRTTVRKMHLSISFHLSASGVMESTAARPGMCGLPFILANEEWTIEKWSKQAGGRSADCHVMKPFVLPEIGIFVRRSFKSVDEDNTGRGSI